MTDPIPRLHINRGVNRRYVAMVRAPGCRNYQRVGDWTRSKAAAHRALMRAMLDSRWKRGVLLFVSDCYDPAPILWVHR